MWKLLLVLVAVVAIAIAVPKAEKPKTQKANSGPYPEQSKSPTNRPTNNISLGDFVLLAKLDEYEHIQRVFAAKRKTSDDMVYALKGFRIEPPYTIEKTNFEFQIMKMFGSKEWATGLVAAFFEGPTVVLVSRYEPGGDVQDELTRLNIGQQQLGLDLGRKLLAASVCILQGLHELDIVFNDFHLANLLIRRNKNVAITDFGEARLLSNTLDRAAKIKATKTDWERAGTIFNLFLAPSVAYEKEIIAELLKLTDDGVEVFKKHDFFGPEYPWASALSDPIFDKKEINIEKMRNAPAIQLEKADNIFEGEMKADQKSKLPGIPYVAFDQGAQ